MKRRRKSTPLMLFWSRQEQRRFIDAVEALVSTVHDLQTTTRELTQLLQVRRARKARPASTPTPAFADAYPVPPIGEAVVDG